MKTKKFDAVKMMRDIRDQLTEEFAKDSQAEDKALKDINAKYSLEAQIKTSAK